MFALPKLPWAIELVQGIWPEGHHPLRSAHRELFIGFLILEVFLLGQELVALVAVVAIIPVAHFFFGRLCVEGDSVPDLGLLEVGSLCQETGMRT